jgi:hypothetical protein
MNRLFTVVVCLFIAGVAVAQSTASIKGRVYDTSTHKGLSYATVSLVNAKDSTLVNFTRADSMGNFLLKKIAKGQYLLSTSYVGFVPTWKKVEVGQQEQVDMGIVAMTDIASASTVSVEAKRPPVVINGDTIEFNSENFKTQPNAVAEDLLKRLPGVTVDADGTVRVNGQRVSRVFVNGKDFFNGDPKMATKNLDADAIDKVQVFDKKSDKAELTGIDDGASQKAINLKLKKDRNNALFGRVAAGAGNNERYEGQTNINKFKGDKQMSFIGMGNNTNKQGFSISDVLNFTGELSRGMRSGGGVTIRTSINDDPGNGLPVTGLGQNQQGIATTWAGGVNFNNNYKKKTDVNASVMASDIHLVTDRTTERQYLFPGNNYTYNNTTSSVRDIKQQRFNMTIDHKIDSFTTLKVTPSFSLQQQRSNSFSQYTSLVASKSKLNDGFNTNNANSTGYLLVGDVLLRHKFKKKGRTISATVSTNLNNSNQDGALNTRNTFYATLPAKDSLLNQINNTDAFTNSIGGNLAYTEPLGKRSLIELSGYYNSTIGKSQRQTFDYNTTTTKHDKLNTLLSNHFRSEYQYAGASLGLRTNMKKLNYSISASLQQAQLNSTNKTTNTTIKQSFTDVLPNVNLRYGFNNFSNLSLGYTTSTQQPSTQQLQPLQNVSDPLNVVEGNPALKRSYAHNLNLNYFSADPVARKNFFVFAFVSFTKQAIVYADEIQTNGARKSRPVNANGNLTFFTNASYGFTIKPLKIRVDAALGYNYLKNIAFINGATNTISNNTINPSLSFNYTLADKLDVRTTANLRLNKAKYSLQEQLNTNFVTQAYAMELTNYLPWGLVVNNNFNYIINTGRSNGFNTNIPFWNASLAKSFLKNKRAELKLAVFDLLNKNIGINRNANQNYIEDLSYNVLQRYFMATFTFRLHKAGGSGTPGVQIRTFSTN